MTPSPTGLITPSPDSEPQILLDNYLRIPTNEPEPRRKRGAQGAEDRTETDEAPPEAEEIEHYQEEGDTIEDLLCGELGLTQIASASEEETTSFGGHPGGLANNPAGHSPRGSTITERLAFYLPFHSYRDWWGIYLLPEGIATVRREMGAWFGFLGLSPREQVMIAKSLLYYHEFYHHAVESFATRLEAIWNLPCYLKAFSPLYKSTFGTSNCLEETCANCYSREKTVSQRGSIDLSGDSLRVPIDDWFRGAPPGYAEAAGTRARWSTEVRPSFYETCVNSCSALMGVPCRTIGASAMKSAWSAAGYFDRGIGDVRSRIFYLIRKDSPIFNRLPTDLRTCVKSRSFKQKLRQLGIARFLKQGGAHELWIPVTGGRPVPIPRHDGADIPKGTMRAILRQLGAPMSIDEFLAA